MSNLVRLLYLEERRINTLVKRTKERLESKEHNYTPGGGMVDIGREPFFAGDFTIDEQALRRAWIRDKAVIIAARAYQDMRQGDHFDLVIDDAITLATLIHDAEIPDK